MNITKTDFSPELFFKASRSGGAGGQNVNKVSSKVELTFDIAKSILLNEKQKATITEKLKGRIDKNGILHIVVQSERSQLQNKQIAIKKFYELLETSLRRKKKRIATKPSLGGKENRIKEKKITSERKYSRKKNLPQE